MKRHLSLLLVLFLGACSAGSVSESELYHEHVVLYEGESLELLAVWYTGRKATVPTLIEQNPQLEAEEHLKTGTTVRIPTRIMTNYNFLTPGFVKNY